MSARNIEWFKKPRLGLHFTVIILASQAQAKLNPDIGLDGYLESNQDTTSLSTELHLGIDYTHPQIRSEIDYHTGLTLGSGQTTLTHSGSAHFDFGPVSRLFGLSLQQQTQQPHWWLADVSQKQLSTTTLNSWARLYTHKLSSIDLILSSQFKNFESQESVLTSLNLKSTQSWRSTFTSTALFSINEFNDLSDEEDYRSYQLGGTADVSTSRKSDLQLALNLSFLSTPKDTEQLISTGELRYNVQQIRSERNFSIQQNLNQQRFELDDGEVLRPLSVQTRVSLSQSFDTLSAFGVLSGEVYWQKQQSILRDEALSSENTGLEISQSSSVLYLLEQHTTYEHQIGSHSSLQQGISSKPILGYRAGIDWAYQWNLDTENLFKYRLVLSKSL